jgi:hypothetical protein
LDASNYFTQVTPISLEQPGGSVGGRILKDKLFWFASFELLRYYVLGQFRVFGFRLTAGKSGPWTTSEWPTIQELARPLNTSAFVGTNPGDCRFIPELPVILPKDM